MRQSAIRFAVARTPAHAAPRAPRRTGARASPFGLHRYDAGASGVFDPRSHLLFARDLIVLGEFVAVEFDTEARAGGHAQASVFVLHLAAHDDVVGEVM